MTDKIYGIFESKYSDWNCIGYFENEEEACRYCAETESKHDNPYVMEIERINCEFSNETVFYEYHCSFKNNEMNWIQLNSCSLHLKPPKIQNSTLHRYVYLTFMIQKCDEELARKTAFDLYAKWKYERGEKTDSKTYYEHKKETFV